MKLSLVYFTFFLIVLLSTADQTEFNTDSCPTSRHLLFFGGLKFPFGEKKTTHVSSSSKSSSSSSPPKYARTDDSHGLTIYIRPQTSAELGQKVRSYSHLLKSKLFSKAELTKLKKLKSDKKKKPETKKKNITQHASKTRDLVAVNDQERDRCRAILQIDHQKGPASSKENKKQKKEKNSISTKVKNITTQAKKTVAAAAAKALPTKEKQKPKKTPDTKSASNEKKKPAKTSNAKSVPEEKVKPTKSNTKSTTDEKKKKPSETITLTPPSPQPPPPVKEVPIKKSTPPPPPPPPAQPPPTSTKSKREKVRPVVIEEPAETFVVNEPDEIENEDKNNSVVGRAYSFVKNMFQLSDDILENNHTHEEDQIFSSTNEQQHRTSRKLLSIDGKNNDQLDDIFIDLSLSNISISKRQLLSVKTNKRSISSKTKDKKTNADSKKPKVGWAYRYRISRFLADQKMKRSGRGNKAIGGGKSKQQQQQQQQQRNKKSSSSSNTKFSKRKLLELDFDDETNLDNEQISNQDIVNTVSIIQDFVPKRQLLATKKHVKKEEESDDESDLEKVNERRRMKSYEDLTDPVEIVRSYDRGLFKPRVGWQFRYRVSRYIDYLRDNIREDQERLKSGLEAIKRKTPQELSGRRKRVLDKPFESEKPAIVPVVEENKPNVGWRYRYRISKMLEAKQRGEYIDDEELKRQARLEQKTKKPTGLPKPAGDDDECVEWEYDIDPELRKIGEEGRRVGWDYRYRIRRKLDELKKIQEETGVPFDMETLGGKREKKVTPAAPTPTDIPAEKQAEEKKKVVGWQYRYRVSKMLEAQKHEAAEAAKAGSKKRVRAPIEEGMDPELARLSPEARVVGWQYRYRIRRKLDALKNASRETEGGKRGKKHKFSTDERTKSKRDEKIIKKVEESIEKILNIDDIEYTPFMEYFRRASSYLFFGLLPTFKKSICLLPLPVTFSFCREDENEIIQPTLTTTELPKLVPAKKLRTKKEKRAKQFIHSRSTSFDTTDEKIDDPVKPLPTTTEKPQLQKKPPRQRVRSPLRRSADEQVKHFDEEEEPIKKLVGVESKRNKNKKRFQIIGQEVKNKPKHSPPSPVVNSPPVATTIPSTPATTTVPPPIVTTAPPKTTSPPTPSSKPATTSTTTPAPPLRTISEIIQEEAATLLSTEASFTDETKEEVNEANENVKEATTTTTIAPSQSSLDSNENTASAETDDDSTSTSSESSSSDSDSDSTEETDDNANPSPIKTMKQFYENAKESVHGVFDLKDDKDSS